MELTALEERLQTSLTLAIPSSKFEEARARIRAFRQEMDVLFDADTDKDLIYHLSISFYPVSEKVLERSWGREGEVTSCLQFQNWSDLPVARQEITDAFAGNSLTSIKTVLECNDEALDL